MSAEDKAKNIAQSVKGNVKETAGKVLDDDELQAKGKADQAKSDVKQAGEKAKDAFKE